MGGRLGSSVVIDVCDPCQLFWFDQYETLQLAPGSTLELFTSIGERTSGGRPAPLSAHLDCPRCAGVLQLAHDRQRDTPFEYLRCAAGHGRLETFLNFLREKQFVRALSLHEIAELKQKVQTTNCSNCGAPVDITSSSACSHCGSPLSIVDFAEAERLISELRAAAAQPHVPDELPLQLARARQQAESAFALSDRIDSQGGGFVEEGLAAFVGWIRGRPT
jgi:hypothetical protein